MNFLIIDGNSIINRAFYGIKMLNASDGHPTNALYGFMSILLSLSEKIRPQAVAVAFDVHQPTFRHKMYDGYKAGRRPTPPELLQQMEPMKELLRAYGCTVIECPGYEADDILGTLSHTAGQDVHCYISTGDRDSLQLISDRVSVMLVTTKLGQTETKEYTPAVLAEEYGLTPAQMIELKALQGDSSDNIKGVPGIGPKTALELIAKYGTVDHIYEHLDEIEVTASVRKKLADGRESAFFSRTLGTICLEAPVDTDIRAYLAAKRDDGQLYALLVRHEMLRLINRLGLKPPAAGQSESADMPANGAARRLGDNDIAFLSSCAGKKCALAFTAEGFVPVSFAVCLDGTVCRYDLSGEGAENGLKELLSDKNGVIYTSGVKTLYKWMLSSGGDIACAVSDAELEAYIIDANRSDFDTDSLCAVNGVRSSLSEEDAAVKDVLDAVRLQPLCEKLSSVLESRGQTELYAGTELPLSRVLAKMELSGMMVDTDGITGFSGMLDKKIEETENRIIEAAGEKFNVNSPKQLGVVLFEKLGLPAKKKTKTGYSTNAEVLEELSADYPIVADILDYRACAKLKSTYCDGLLKAVCADGRVRSTFTQTETRTGRLSSVEPNLQNIPVRTELGREMRRFFVAAPGKVLIDADYSQIELRVLSALAGDENMLGAFNRGDDIHTITAAKVFGLPAEQVTHELRSRAKAVNFGIVYGIGAFSLAKDIHTTKKEAESFINSYLALYSSVDDYLNNAVTEAKENGYAETRFGRRRYLPELSASNHMVRAFGERVAKNAPIQGTAADIIKMAMVRVDKRLSEEFPEASLIMQVHDELIIEAPAGQAEAVGKLLRYEMENAVSLGVELSVEVGVGESWYEAKN